MIKASSQARIRGVLPLDSSTSCQEEIEIKAEQKRSFENRRGNKRDKNRRTRSKEAIRRDTVLQAATKFNKYVRSRRAPRAPEFAEYDQVPDETDAFYVGLVGRPHAELLERKSALRLKKEKEANLAKLLDKKRVTIHEPGIRNSDESMASRASSFYLGDKTLYRREGAMVRDKKGKLVDGKDQGVVQIGSRANHYFDQNIMTNEDMKANLLKFQNTKATFDVDLSDDEYEKDQLFWAVDLNEAELLNEPIKDVVDIKRCLWFSGGHSTDDEWVSVELGHRGGIHRVDATSTSIFVILTPSTGGSRWI